MMYAPMKNLSKPLPNAQLPSFSSLKDNISSQTPLLTGRMPRPHPLSNMEKQNSDISKATEHRGGWKELEIVEDDPLSSKFSHNSVPRDDDQESIIRCVGAKASSKPYAMLVLTCCMP